MNKSSKKILFCFLFTLILLPVLSQQTSAQETQTPATTGSMEKSINNLNIIGNITGLGQANNAPDAGLYSKAAAIVNIMLGFAGIISMIIIIYAGFKWITAQGNDEQVGEAKKSIRDATIGLTVIFLAYVLVNFVITKLIQIFQ